jgi:hypothetical protein
MNEPSTSSVCSDADPEIADQLRFVEWMKLQGIYNEYASAQSMRQMHSVWNRMNQLTVVRAAIRDDRGAVWSLPQPNRHHDIIKVMREAGYDGPLRGDQQGFVLSDGRFVRRKPAKMVAHRAGQIKRGETIAATLTSEDLW